MDVSSQDAVESQGNRVGKGEIKAELLAVLLGARVVVLNLINPRPSLNDY
jgi:hypothetical protein